MSTSQENGPRNQLQSVKSRYLYHEVAREIERYIVSNELSVGAQLPPERDLANQLQTSRASVREALRVLELVGLIRTRRSEPAVVGEVDLQVLTEWVSRSIPRSWATMMELLDVREVLEVRSAQLAAQHITAEQVDELRANLALTAARVAAGDQVLQQDIEFHSIIFRASGNAVMQRLTDLIGGLLTDLRMQFLQRSGRGAEMVRFHTAIAEAIIASSPAAAAEAMQAHMTSVKTVARQTRAAQSDGAISPVSTEPSRVPDGGPV